MPRDLSAEEKPAPLTESPHSTEEPDKQEEGRFVVLSPDKVDHAAQNLHPYTSPLTLADLESCVALENEAFAENERCSREKVSLDTVSLHLSCA
jgi:hypothetical protein